MMSFLAYTIIILLRRLFCWHMLVILRSCGDRDKKPITSKATVNDARYKVSRIVKLVEIVEIKVDCHFYFYYALVGLYSVNIFC